MSTSTVMGNSDGLVTGLCPAPPPPPPPPPAPGQVPAMKINTAEAPTIRRQQMASNGAYEPPAAIQNAMLTKDKKPFTYTPGMGGKLDLSQIRSPRMARRVAKNANDEGIEGPPKSALEQKPTPAPNTGATLFVQPQVAIPVLPTNVPVQPPANRTPPTPPVNRTQPSTPEKQPESPKLVTKVETKVTPVIAIQPSTPDSPNTPTQVTLTKAPTPWLQNKNKPQEELPEWAKRSPVNKQNSSSSSSPDSPTSPPIYASSIQQAPQWQQAQQKPQQAQQRPLSQPMQQQAQQQAQQYHYQQQQPQQFNQQPQPQQFNQQQKRPFSSPAMNQHTPQTHTPERVIPIRIEDRPSVFDVKQEQGHHQFKQPSPHHQQRWGQGSAQNQVQSQMAQHPVQPQQSTGGTFIIPIVIEGCDKKPAVGPTSNVVYAQPTVRNNVPSVVEGQPVKTVAQRIIPAQIQQSDSGPVQSRSFRVLQKITDTDSPNDVDTEQIRKLQLSEDDRILMNKFKEQVDNDSSLHHEEDPRYRGAAIPSRAFRFLQNMTESGETPVMNTTPRPPSAINKKQNRNSKTFEETQANLPPSEQQVPEPKKYMGSAIPSRSFRILQAMTAPEIVATQENRQADNHCQTENNVPGNQQGVFLPPCPPPFWSPESGWWGYYPLPYPGVTNDAYPYNPDNTAYIYFPIYNQNYPGYPRFDPANNKNTYPSVYPPYMVPVPQQNGVNNRAYNFVPTDGNYIVAKIEPENGQINSDEIEENQDIPSTDNADTNGFATWNRVNSMSRTASNNSKDSDCTTAMNITDEEEIPETIDTAETEENIKEPARVEAKATSNVVNVPNYTYIDTSDSSDSTDSDSSQSDNESIAESSKISTDNGSDDSSTDTDDSESYLAYSTGLNPHGRSEKECEKASNRLCSSKEPCNERPGSDSSSKNNTDCDSDAEEQTDQEPEKTDPNTTYPHQLSVIYEDVERPDSESPRPPEVKIAKNCNETPFEATDDPPDDVDTATVSVSLPLRFRFSVSENNEDVTTVIVGDSTIKPERVYVKDDNKNSKIQENKKDIEKNNEVCVDFEVANETSVDFTLKKDRFDDKRKPKKDVGEKIKETVVESKMDKDEDPVVPHVNFTLRRIPSRLRKINCEETVETEFTIRRRPTVKKEEDTTNKCSEDRVQDSSVKNSSEESLNKESSNKDTNFTNNEFLDTSLETHDFNRNILKPKVIVFDCNCNEDTDKEYSNSVQTIVSTMERNNTSREATEVGRKIKHEDEVDEKTGPDTKHLLSVQNSREETDDEDSGVTSDMSRMISEVDTDSECTSSRNMRKYQRTQTHSRLFKLLNDDSILLEGSEKPEDCPSRREYLSLPLKNNNFNYDDNYCSNYSSGLTSPEYSPVCEQSWRRLHDTENCRVPDQNGDPFRQGHPLNRHDKISCKEDPYYQAWKSPKSQVSEVVDDADVVPSLAFKVLESRRPLWSYKVNVLCPRIKSTKNVPRALRKSKQTDSTVAPPTYPSSLHGHVKNDHC